MNILKKIKQFFAILFDRKNSLSFREKWLIYKGLRAAQKGRFLEESL